MSFKYPLATSTWDEEEIVHMNRVISSGRFTMGSEVQTFERSFARFMGSKFAIMVNSGSSANLLMIAALFFSKNPDLKLKRGDEVIVPAVSWATTFAPLQQYGLRVKFVDVDIETLNFDMAQLSEAITDNTRLIFAVNLLGNPNDFTPLLQLTAGKNIVLLEDNCESLGAQYGSAFAGNYGVMGSFSTFFSHHISTMEGGVIITNNEELYHILLSLRAHGWTRNLPESNHVSGVKEKNSFSESFKFVLPGYNLRPLEMSGAIGQSQIKKIPEIIKGRRANAALFQKLFHSHPDLIIQQEIGESSWFGFSFIIRPSSGMRRSDLIQKLEAGGFECRPIVAGNFTLNPAMEYFESEIFGCLRNANIVHHNGLFIGNHHYDMSEALACLTNILS